MFFALQDSDDSDATDEDEPEELLASRYFGADVDTEEDATCTDVYDSDAYEEPPADAATLDVP